MLCPNCGSNVGEQIRLCDACAEKLQPPKDTGAAVADAIDATDVEVAEDDQARSSERPSAGSEDAGGTEHSSSFAGFWLRFAASIVDAAILSIVQLVLAFVFGGLFSGAAASFFEQDVSSTAVMLALMGAALGVIILNICTGWLYYAACECSLLQATIGKKLIGLRVTRSAGERVTFLRATGRYFGKFLSALTLGIGFVLAAFTPRKQALHDMLADCVVVRAETVPLPRVFGSVVLGIILLGIVGSLGPTSDTAVENVPNSEPSGAASTPSVPSTTDVVPNELSNGLLNVGVTQGTIRAGASKIAIAAAYGRYLAMENSLQVLFFREALTLEQRQELETAEKLDDLVTTSPDAVLSIRFAPGTTACERGAVQQILMVLYRSADGLSQGGEFELKPQNGFESLACQLQDGGVFSLTLNEQTTKQTSAGLVEVAWKISSRGVLTGVGSAGDVSYDWESAADQVALWDPERNSLTVGFFEAKLTSSERLQIRKANSLRAIEGKQPAVEISFDARENPQQLTPESLIKYGITFRRGVTDSISFPGADDTINFFYVPMVQAGERLWGLAGDLREGEAVRGGLTNSAEKQLEGIPVRFHWKLEFNTPVIDASSEPSATELADAANEPTKNVPSTEGPHARATAGDATVEFQSVVALYYPESGDLAVGFYVDPISEAEREIIRSKRFLWTYVNEKRPNLVLLLDFRRTSSEVAFEELLSYTAYFYRDKIGSFYFPGQHDRRSFKKIEVELSRDEIRRLAGSTEEGGIVTLTMVGAHGTEEAGVQFSWDVDVSTKVLVVK
ncbi:MAG: RDD family protein [Bdellovibrionales bacterium]|nr:RDD family protein [Bdellovibrionales bacterium]